MWVVNCRAQVVGEGLRAISSSALLLAQVGLHGTSSQQPQPALMLSTVQLPVLWAQSGN